MKTYQELVVQILHLNNKDVITSSTDNVGAWNGDWNSFVEGD